MLEGLGTKVHRELTAETTKLRASADLLASLEAFRGDSLRAGFACGIFSYILWTLGFTLSED